MKQKYKILPEATSKYYIVSYPSFLQLKKVFRLM